MGSNWNMLLLYKGGNKIVQSHAARGDNLRVASNQGNTVLIVTNNLIVSKSDVYSKSIDVHEI